MNDETAAMKTAKPSAVKTMLNPKARGMLNVAVFPDMTRGINAAERMNEADMNIKDR
jgi:hypothetical protein